MWRARSTCHSRSSVWPVGGRASAHAGTPPRPSKPAGRQLGVRAIVNHRYSDAVDMMTGEFPDDYRYGPIGFRLTIAEAFSAIGCFEYQSCERPGRGRF